MADIDPAMRAELEREIRRRRTFAIISHPDAGKTTLTEKLLLYSGLLRTAGMVGARKTSKGAASDWMGMEAERGISISASAMQFPYKDCLINVLDTPGHQDFCEDTYRTLTAADSAIMVIDAAKGIESQTRKLFEACRLRGIPVFTFINKMDMPSRDPLDLMAEVEETLGIQASAANWPIGSGSDFVGVVDRKSQTAHLYTKTGVAGSSKPDVEKVPAADLATHERLAHGLGEEVADQLELLEEAGNPFSEEAFLAGKVTPVFFGSALTNFGVEPIYDAFTEIAPFPTPRKVEGGDIDHVDPVAEPFSAYVFKLQANMNPKHRDSVAFLRINSGRYEKDLVVKNQRSGRKMRLSRPHSLVVNERHTLETAYPGDVIGIINSGDYALGDTLSARGSYQYEALPAFQPEVFARIAPSDLGKRKAFDKGLNQLVAEGAIQMMRDFHNSGADPIIGAVGQLQFEVFQYRLEDEYKVTTTLNPLPYECSAWLFGDLDTFNKPYSALLVKDLRERPMLLFPKEWDKDFAAKDNPDHQLLDFA